MIDKEEFRKSPKFTALTAKVKAALDANPDYIKAASKLKAARDIYIEKWNNKRKTLMKPCLEPKMLKKMHQTQRTRIELLTL